MVVEASPTAAKNCITGSEDVVRNSKPGLIQQRSSREPSERNRFVSRVPGEAAERWRSSAARLVLRHIENRISEVFVVKPGCEVGEPHSELKGQLPARFPGILPEELPGVIGNVIEPVEVCFVVAVEIASQ